ncbi:winged helix-turn-helix domain-containing protein [Pseudomonas silvicola]|nr:winged helix-turn-helix domain-containing protein [Pseudomonas silvicola]
MKKPWETNLTARFIFLLLLALITSQLLTLSISWDERGNALREVAKGEFLNRSASLALLLDSMPVEARDGILNVSNTTYGRFWVNTNEPRTPSQWWASAREHLLAPLSGNDHLEDARLTAKVASENLPAAHVDALANWSTPATNLWPSPRPAKFLYLAPLNVMGIATPLKDGSWLQAVYAKPVEGSPFEKKAVFSWLVTALALSAIAALIAREISRPLKRLAEAAERLGRGEVTDDLQETGPTDIRRTAKAFNRMQLRIRRFVEDRTCMLAAIGHDLRTPLTSLRLRAEFVGDADLQAKMLGTIAEISAMTEDLDVILGLELGADDYLAKPFNPRELLARIKAILRRVQRPVEAPAAPVTESIQFGQWTFNRKLRELVGADGISTPLSASEFKLLCVFVDHPEQVLTRDELLEQVAGRQQDYFDRSIDNQVSRLRKKIEADPRQPRHIKTHWGGGYSFSLLDCSS